MTDRIKGFTVTLTEDIRIDDFESIMDAVQMIKGVAEVNPSLVTSEDYMNRAKIKREMEDAILKVFLENT